MMQRFSAFLSFIFIGSELRCCVSKASTKSINLYLSQDRVIAESHKLTPCQTHHAYGQDRYNSTESYQSSNTLNHEYGTH